MRDYNKELEKEAKTLEATRTQFESRFGSYEGSIEFYKKFGGALILIGAIVMIGGIIPFHCGNQTLNLYGDFIGGAVSSLWGLAGLIFIYIAFLRQSQQVITQQLELKYSQFEQKATRFEFEKQNETMHQQQFENSFFKLIDNYRKLSDDFVIESSAGKHISGKKYFEYLAKSELSEKKYKRYIETVHSTLNTSEIENSKFYFYGDVYSQMLNVHQSYLRPWLRSIEIILHYVDSSTLVSNEGKPLYISILRSQLSPYEMFIIGLDIMFSIIGYVRYQPLVHKYRLLTDPSGFLQEYPTLNDIFREQGHQFAFFDEGSPVEDPSDKES
jgi:hypothetical protein